MSIGDILTVEKERIPEVAMSIHASDLPYLVEKLSETNDNIRYCAFLLLQYRSRIQDDVYPFWTVFEAKLNNLNSYQRSIGMMLLAENVRWDKANLIENTLPACLNLLRDEKPITMRQCIQSLGIIATEKPGLAEIIAEELIKIDLSSIKETMRKSILTDIVHVLLSIRKTLRTDSIDHFLFDTRSCEMLDRKTIREIEACL